MKSGLSILGVVLIAAVLVGLYYNHKHREIREWAEIEATKDVRTRLDRLEAFIGDYPESEHRPEAYELLADLSLKDVRDTAAFLIFAEDLLSIEEDPASREALIEGLDRARNTRGSLTEIQGIEDPEARISALENFISDFPQSGNKYRAYYMIGRAMGDGLKDTARLDEFAERVLIEESDIESKAAMYYLLYTTHIEPDPPKALGTARRLLQDSVDVDWVYASIGYDLGDREKDLDLALLLCTKALDISKTGQDSAGGFDCRGWIHYKQGDYGEALADFEAAVDMSEEPYEEVLAHLAEAALRAGETDKAFETFRSILVMGEYDYARSTLDSLMDIRGYSDEDKRDFELSIWDARLAGAGAAEGFELPTLAGGLYSYEPSSGRVALLNFMSPT